MQSIDKLFTKYGSDKGPDAHDYGTAYSDIFELFRLKKNINLLEVGVSTGSSIAVWADYFPTAQIVGADIDLNQCKPELLASFQSNSRIKLIEGDATADGIIPEIEKYAPFDLIIDDGSHYSNDIINSFELLFFSDILKPGGYYIVEDLNYSYLPKNSFVFKVLNRFFNRNRDQDYTHKIARLCKMFNLGGPGVSGGHKQYQTMNFFKERLDDINLHGKNIGGRNKIINYIKSEGNKYEKWVEWIQFRRELIVIKKRGD